MADKTLLILEKLSALSHLKERKEKNCLNCNAHVQGKYCHICGQENIEPAESAWHLITHFFNDITHFDGKFFSTLKLLITKPGFLSAEYKRGRRASYLNPVRMYVFTSFIFFIIFFSLFSADDPGFNSTTVSGRTPEQIEKMDSTEFATFTKVITGGKRSLSRKEYKVYIDSLTTDSSYTIVGKNYRSMAEYDSLVKAGKTSDSWLSRTLAKKNIDMKKKYRNQQEAMKSLWEKLTHYFPQILFISLPFFALLLRLIYIRRKDFYFVAHGIYSIHLYIFYFITLLAMLVLNRLGEWLDWGIFGWLEAALLIFLYIYEYKAMRHFYGQRRAKTIFKFLLAIIGRVIIIIILFILFFFLSAYNL